MRDVLAGTSSLRDWSECRKTLLEMAAAEDPWQLVLPIFACQAVGGEAEDAYLVAGAWTILRQAANLIDAVQDHDPLPAALDGDLASALSCAAGLIFAVFQMINEAEMGPRAARRVGTAFAEAGLDSALGQNLSLSLVNEPVDTDQGLERYWKAVILKSGSIYRAGTTAGAACGTNQKKLISALGDFGSSIGVIRQILDDCRDLILDPASGTHETTLPALLYALSDGNAEDTRPEYSPADLIAALQDEKVPEVIADVLAEWRRRALQSLEGVRRNPGREALEHIADQILAPGRKAG